MILSWVGFWLNRYYFLSFEANPAALFMWIRSLECGKDAKDAKVVDKKDVITREATSDRITLGVTAVLTLSAISLDSRSDLPKVIRTIIEIMMDVIEMTADYIFI